ncbi:hypothetical protein [Luteimonas saliphila]|uniref:hypothetical protein n=1 Tax=Luteimonas saliphila TaxID=2804919 RepID=UPI00192D547F|nr:hypothetical protein [Luteimonas saliphila]
MPPQHSPARTLPGSFRWSDSDTGSVLFLRYGAVASVTVDGHVTLLGGKRVEGPAASLAQGKRFVERWIAANGPPMTARMWEIRERLRAQD